MDWFKIATNDWNLYQDTSRIAKYITFNKITIEQYELITGVPY